MSHVTVKQALDVPEEWIRRLWLLAIHACEKQERRRMTRKAIQEEGAMEIMPLSADLLKPAAAMFVANYGRARARQPLLPTCHADQSKVLSLLADLAGREEGVAVRSNGRLLGYGIGFAIPNWHGWRSAIMPEWAHATVRDDAPVIRRAIYERLSKYWAADGRTCHLVCMLSDGAPLDEWQWVGFGLQCVDAVRGLEPAAGSGGPCEVRRTAPQDATIVAHLMTKLHGHLSDAPVFLPAEPPVDPEETKAALAHPQRAHFLAQVDGEAVGFLSIRGENTDASWVVQDAGTAGIDGAYTLPAHRGSGVATALLDEALRWARATGYSRCAVDFEAHNAPARAFWLRHFEPVAYSVARCVRNPGSEVAS